MANIKRFRKIVAFIEETLPVNSKLKFNMGEWFLELPEGEEKLSDYWDHKTSEFVDVAVDCGTNMCLAGWAAFYEGAQFISNKLEYLTDTRAFFPKVLKDYQRGVLGFHEAGVDIELWAQDYFELESHEVDEIFYPSGDPKDINQLKRTINEVLGEEVFQL